MEQAECISGRKNDFIYVYIFHIYIYESKARKIPVRQENTKDHKTNPAMWVVDPGGTTSIEARYFRCSVISPSKV